MGNKIFLVQDILAAMLYTSFIVFATNNVGVYYMIAFTAAIVLLQYMNAGLSLKFELFSKYMLAWGTFCFVSAFWAYDAHYAIEKGTTIIELTVVFTLLYSCYRNESLERLLKIVMWAGFLLTLYTFFFVGIDTISDTIEEAGRLENTFANINTVGMTACSSMLISVYFYMFSKKRVVEVLFNIPALYIVAASGSRKAFVMLIMGIVVLYYFKIKQSSSKGISSRLITILTSLVVLVVIGYFLAESGLFGGTIYRMTRLIDAFTGGDNADSSSLVRAYMREIGFNQFYETPLLGIGMGNARILALQYYGHDCYLHCNYAELAADGGTVALLLYYWIYIRMLKQEREIMKYDVMAYIVLLLILLQVIMDYGMVSYYAKKTYFLLMIFMIHIEKSKSTYVQ